MKYDVIIGLEIHIQLKTQSKMFCSCSTDYFGKDPNTLTCPVCTGMPGTLPIPNKRAIELCILMGLATDCAIDQSIKFDRKHYFYPDLPKGYQISQYDEPLCKNGYVMIREDDRTEKIEIERIHQEEDVAKSHHIVDPTTGLEYSLIDYNKAGIPLMEIVSKPVIRSAADARLYAARIRQIARYLDISDADMEKGQMRCEPNVSIQLPGTWKYNDGKILPAEKSNKSDKAAKLNPKVEIKNIGSITAVEKSIDYEIEWMSRELENGNELEQQTRGWNAHTGETEFQRTKESAEDYRYFKEPDIPIINVSTSNVDTIGEQLVKLPSERENNYIEKLSLTPYDACVIADDRANSEFFDELVSKVSEEISGDLSEAAKLSANWLTGIIFAYMNDSGKKITDINLRLEDLAHIIAEVQAGKANNQKAKKLVRKALETDGNLGELYESANTQVISDVDELETIAKKVINANEKAAQDFKSGKQNAIGFLIGQIMKESKGNADPNKAREVLIKLLES
ncbi:Asp-tRNA(Asn)/Glu-tRNA(Gln) amidotransferase subunit GatB [Candidatus Dojkabacteria bacterium]|nr:Asp-tRNA(Asn)/Glu-tRNA(Gln) amidotransferase subunit GatB [Candidatus Dojkabacteria bacterium]